MPASIIERVIGGETDRKLVLANGQAIRPLTIGSDWTRIRIGLRLGIVGSGAALVNPGLFFGLCSGNTGWADPNCAHAQGMYFTTATMTYNANTGGTLDRHYYYGTLQPYRKTSGVVAANSAGGQTSNFSACPQLARSVLVLEITRGATTNAWKWQFVYLNSVTAAVGVKDVIQSKFLEGMEVSAMTGISVVIAAAGEYSYNSLAALTLVDEGTYGALDSVNIYWPRTTWPLEISDVVVARME